MTRKLVLALIALLGMAAAAGRYVYVQTRSYENTALASTRWEETSSPMVAEVVVVDRMKRPMPGANVRIVNNSGGNSAVTDASGLARIDLGEREVEQLLVDGAVVVDRPYADTLNNPIVERGLRFEVNLKQK